MSKNTELFGAVVIIVVLAGMLMASFIRHLRWEERRLRWHIRIATHCILFCGAVAAALYFLSHTHHTPLSL